MGKGSKALVICILFAFRSAMAQVPEVKPRVLTKPDIDGKVAVVEVAAHFVTAIRMPETVNSVVVGDPTLFKVEHSDKEPQIVFVKAVTEKPAETNLLISTTHGREASVLLVSRGEQNPNDPENVDLLLNYKPAKGFLIEPDYPSVLVAKTVEVGSPGSGVVPAVLETTSAGGPAADVKQAASIPSDPPDASAPTGLDELLARQERSPLPALYGERVSAEPATGDRVRAGVGEVVDGGERVIVLFSAVNPTGQSILIMPPQVQLGGKVKSGKIIRRSRWTIAEQLPVLSFRLSKRRLAAGERADGVVVFDRPPYKQSNETLFLQIAEAGAVDHPALAPIGFGLNTLKEDSSHGQPVKGK
jgi:hypothetical protein